MLEVEDAHENILFKKIFNSCIEPRRLHKVYRLTPCVDGFQKKLPVFRVINLAVILLHY